MAVSELNNKFFSHKTSSGFSIQIRGVGDGSGNPKKIEWYNDLSINDKTIGSLNLATFGNVLEYFEALIKLCGHTYIKDLLQLLKETENESVHEFINKRAKEQGLIK